MPVTRKFKTKKQKISSDLRKEIVLTKQQRIAEDIERLYQEIEKSLEEATTRKERWYHKLMFWR